MVVFSKLFQAPYNTYDCSEFLCHDGHTCCALFFYNFYRGAISSSRYFLPLAISPLVLKAKKLNVPRLCDILRHYVGTVLWTGAAGAATFSMICLLRKCLGRFYYYSSAFLPAYIAFQLIWYFPLRTVRLFGTGTTQAALETLLHQHKNRCTRLVTQSRRTQTLLFMLASAVVMHFARQKDYNGFWFIQPIAAATKAVAATPTTTNAQEEAQLAPEAPPKSSPDCVHPGESCQYFILNGMKSYLMYGIPLDTLSVIMKGKLPKSFADIANKMRKMRFKMTAFFLSYVGIYRLSLCMLTRYTPGSSDVLQHALAAFLGGTSYIFLGKLTIAVFAAVLAIQAAWQHFCNKSYDARKQRLPALLQRIPFSRLAFPLNTAYLIHAYVFHHESISHLASAFLNGATDGRIDRVYQFLLHYISIVS